MVFFNCDGCGETLKKNQVDGHASRCRNCYAVSCVDCSISFYGDDFRSHTTCSMTEVDNLVANRGGKNKKQTPQEAWMELLQTSVSTAPSEVKDHLQQMVQLDNVPRKEKQFRNFAMNSLNLRGGQHAKKILDSIWDHLNQQREKLKKAKAEVEQAKKEKKEKKEQQKQPTKDEESSVSGAEEEQPTSTADAASSSNKVSDTDNNDGDKVLYKNVKKATKKILKKAKGQSMKYKSLQKELREKMGVDKNKLKETMDQLVAKETKKFQLEGKEIKLIVT